MTLDAFQEEVLRNDRREASSRPKQYHTLREDVMRHKPSLQWNGTVQEHKQRDMYMEWRRFFLERKRFGQELVVENVIVLFEEWRKEKERDEIRYLIRSQ
jgi:hypothetical protein